MIDNGGVVIRLRWQGLNTPTGGNVGMTEWVPFVAPATNATLVLTPASISENAGVSTVTATLDQTTSAATTITVSAAAVAPAVSGDFTLTGTTLTIAATATTSTGTVTITASNNNLDAPDKSVTVSGTATGEVGNPSDVTLTIADDDDPPTLSIDSPSMTEGNSGTATLTFTVTLSAASGQQVTVGYADAGTGTATSGTDYTAITAGTLTFAAGTTSQTFNVAALGDTLDEADETVVVTLSSPTNAAVSNTVGTGTGTITDDDDPPTVSIDSPSVTEGDSGSKNLTFTATLSAASGRQVTVAYADATTGTATAGTDYTTITAGTLTFAAGTTSQTFNVSVTGDTTDEVDETVVVTLSGATNATVSATTGTGTGTITDDDGPTVSVNSPSVTEGDSGSTNLTFTATLSAASVQQVTVAWAEGTGSTATSGTDYTAITGGTLTFTAGTTSQTFNVAVTGDTTDELNETVVVTLSSPTNATIATGTGTGTITDDDGPTVSIDSPSVTEGDSGSTNLTFTVSLSAASVQQVTVAYADAGTGTATSGTDYTAITGGTLTFAAGTTSQTFNVSVTGDTTDEANETVVVTLSSPTNATISTANGTGMITNDDGSTVSIDSPSVTEGDSGSTNLTFTVTLSAASVQQVTVGYTDAGTGTATAGTDYTAITAGTLTFATGTTSQTFNVSVTGDTTDEANETIVVTLSSATNATIAAGAGTGTITDDDGPTVSINSPSVTEGDSGSTNLTFTVTLSAASAQQVTVAYADAGTGTATAGTDYTAITAGTLTFATGTTSQTFNVSVLGDVLDESNETVVVTLSAPTNAAVSSTAGTGTGTITDNDATPSITLTVDDSSVGEGDGPTTITVTATVDGTTRFGAATTVTVSVAGSGTAGAVDFAAVADFDIEIAAGAASETGTFTLTPTDDTTDETGETITVSGASASGGLTVNPATISLTDDDGPMVSIDSPSVTEGDSGSKSLTFTVTLSPASGQQVTVGYADAGTGTATSGTDYTAIPAGTLTFTAGTTSQTIAVTVAGDVLDEADETIVVTLSAPVNATLAAASGTGTIADDDDADLRVETTGPGATTRTVNGHTVTVVEGDGVPAGVVVLLPVALDRDVELRFAPPVAGVPFESARFGLGEDPDRRTVVDVTADPVPSGGVDLCLPVDPSLRAEAGERRLRLLHYGEAGWAEVAGGSRDDAARGLVCASGVATFSPFAVGYNDLKPTFAGAALAPQRYVQGLEIAPLVLPAATDGDGPLAYALAPALPEGLAYTAPTDATSGGTLAGTPAVPAQAADWTLTATDADGDTVTLRFTIEVAPDVSNLMPSFGGAQVPAQRYVQGLEIDPLVLPAATGGDLPLTYALTGPGPASALPEGLAWSESAVTRPTRPGTLAGTPTEVAQAATWTLTATDADGDPATLTFTIEVLDRLRVRLKGINEALLPDLSRAMTASTMDAVSGRIGQALSGNGAGAHGAMASADVLTGLAGLLQANEQALEDGTWSWKQGLAGRRFALALSEDGPATGAGARVTAWGAGDYRSLAGDGDGSGVDWDGHLFGAHLGMDARFGAGGLAGLALSVSEGRFDYTDTSAEALGKTVEGEYESRMTSVHPYVGWAWPAGTHAWASLGYGRGDVTLTDGEAGRHTSDSTLRSAAAGGSVRVLSGEGPGVFGPVTVDLKGEAWTTRLEVEDNGARIVGLAVRTHRLRVAAEGARAFALGGGAAFTPSVELGMRLDGGDGETGAGVELGGGLDYAHPALGLSADVAGRVLLAHEGATEDWSVGGAVRLEPASGRGLSLRLAPSYGETGSGLSRLWEGAGAGSGAGTTSASPVARLDTEMGYGLAAFAGVLTPYGGLGLSEGGTRGYRLGARFLLGPAFELDLEGERRESRTERAGHGLMLRGRMRW